jgi:hypothetical protein
MDWWKPNVTVKMKRIHKEVQTQASGYF